jgi:hypothetical protein
LHPPSFNWPDIWLSLNAIADILYGCHLLRCLYNIVYFLWLYDGFYVILYWRIKKINIFVPSTHAYTHVLCLSLDFPYETRYDFDYKYIIYIYVFSCCVLYIYVWKFNPTVLELDLWAHTIDTLQHQSLSLMSSALDHSTTSAI